MFRTLDDIGNNALAFEAVGTITDDDYQKTLIPSVEEALNAHGKARLLIWFGDAFENYSPHAALDDMVCGVKHWRDFEKLAVVSDVSWIRNGAYLFLRLMPAEVKVFGDGQIDEATAWIAA